MIRLAIVEYHYAEGPVAIAHGGVDMEPSAATFATLSQATQTATTRLLAQAEPTTAAVAAVEIIDDDPAFNCGYGSVLTREGTVETDGAVSDGRSGRFAGIGAAPDVRHPATVALDLLALEGPVLLAGDRARDFAAAHGTPTDTSLVTEEQQDALARYTADPTRSIFTGRIPSETVGCIGVTAEGWVATASSTGGLLGTLPGRVGDSAVVGAGFWSDERFGILCSGSGEVAIARRLAASTAELAASVGLRDAVSRVITEAVADGRSVFAVVGVDAQTRSIVAAHSGASFPVAVSTPAETVHLGAPETGAHS